MHSEHRFSDPDTLTKGLTDFCLARLEESLAVHPRISLLLSGGNSPMPFYRELGRQPLPWDRMHLALVDERWVPLDHPASNERMLRETLGPQAASRLTGMYDGSPSAAAALPATIDRYNALPRPWSLALLGMGPDGHTASLFPDAEGLNDALGTEQPCAAIRAVPSAVTGATPERMTLSLRALLGIEHLVLLFTGESKWQVYQDALANPCPASTPVSYLLQQGSVPLDVFWCP